MASVTRSRIEEVPPSRFVWWAREGMLRVPDFQRAYRWAPDDVAHLVDSVLHRYPIGNLVLALRPAYVDTLRIAHLTVSAPEVSTAYWVVDGHQRIVSLVGALTAKGDSGGPRFRVFYDLGADTVLPLAPGESPGEDWLPVSRLLSPAEVMFWIKERPHLTGTQIDRAGRAVAAIRDNTISAYMVTADGDEALRQMFTRANATGRVLTRDEARNAEPSLPEKVKRP